MTRDAFERRDDRRGPAVFEAGSNLDPFQVLTAEHALIRLRFARTLEAARKHPAGADARTALATLADSFRIHQRREDLVMYPLCERLFGGPDGAASALREDHEAIRGALEQLLTDPVRLGPVSIRSLEAFHRQLEEHFVKEERVLFPLMTAYLPGKECASLARRLRAAVTA